MKSVEDKLKAAINAALLQSKQATKTARGETRITQAASALLLSIAIALSAVSLTSCAKGAADEICVISREAGSGTRGAFIELFGIEKKDETGKKIDMTVDTADVTNSTAVVLQSVAGNTGAIGYVSLGSLSNTVKALNIDGAEPTAKAVKEGKYKATRPFLVVTKPQIEDTNAAASEFLRFIISSDGQAVVEKAGCVAAANNPSYMQNVKQGSVTVAGSSSVTPVMEKLIEAFKKVNSGIDVTVQQSDSTTGITSAMQGVCDIGMSSRELKSGEDGLVATKIATDGIAIVVNKACTIDLLTAEQVRRIFTGEVTKWSEVK